MFAQTWKAMLKVRDKAAFCIYQFSHFVGLFGGLLICKTGQSRVYCIKIRWTIDAKLLQDDIELLLLDSSIIYTPQTPHKNCQYPVVSNK